MARGKIISRENINLNQLIYPLFVKEGEGLREEILSMPGVYRFSPDILVEEAAALAKKGLKAVLIFGVPKYKDWQGISAYKQGNIVSEAVRLLKVRVPEITVIADICLCAYTPEAHCGVVREGRTRIDNPATLKALSQAGLSYAQAGADFVAPSAMAKSQVRAIRNILDENGCQHTKIMGYSAKFASNFYGPFREIADSAPRFGDRRTYQLDYTESERALAEIEQDIAQGADRVMVKPALGYLDIVKEAKARFNYPLAVYNVSGEYAMVKKGAQLGFWDEKSMVLEIISSIKRAGADFIITYHAKNIAQWLNEQGERDEKGVYQKQITV